MRRFLRFFFKSDDRPVAVPRPRTPNDSTYYRSASHPSLSVGQVRHRQFPDARRGLDPDEVHGFLHRVANELAAARAELARTNAENVRIKQALRDWQSRFAPRVRA